MGDRYVVLSNGDAFKIFLNAEGSECYKDKEGKTKKVRTNQKVTEGPPDVVQEASGGFKFATDTELFRATLPPAQEIWDANKNVDKYTGFSQSETEKLTFDRLSNVVEYYGDNERAIKVERDHTVEIQMVSCAWNRANNGRHRNTRATLKCIRDSVNHLDNLNCTPGAVNMKKERAVRTFLGDFESENGKGLRENLQHFGVGRNTIRRICTTLEQSAYKIADKVKEEGSEVYDDFADEITSIIGHIKLD